MTSETHDEATVERVAEAIANRVRDRLTAPAEWFRELARVALTAQKEECPHEWADGSGEVIESGWVCTRCWASRTAEEE